MSEERSSGLQPRGRLGDTRLKIRWSRLEHLDFTPDGGQVYALSGWDGAVRAWSVQSGAPTFVIPEARPARVITRGLEGDVMALLDGAGFCRAMSLDDGRLLWSTDPARDASPLTMDSGTLSVDPGLSRVSGCHGGRELFVKALEDGRLLHRLPLATRGQSAASTFLGAEAELLAARQYRQVQLWRSSDGEPLGTVELPERTSPGLVAVPGGSTFLTLRYDFGEGVTTVDLWSAPSGEPLASHRLPGQVACHSLSADGATLALAMTDEARRRLVTLELGSGQVAEVELGAWLPSRVAVSSGGRHVAAGSFRQPTLRLFDVASGARLHATEGHDGAVRRLAFSGPRRLLSVGEDGVALAVGLEQNALEVLGRRGGPGEMMWDVEPLPSGDRAAATTTEGELHLLELPALADGEAVELGEDERAVQVRHLEGLLPELLLLGHPDQLNPNLPPSASPLVRVDLNQREVVGRGRTSHRLSGPFALSPTGATLAVDDYRHVVLLDARTGALERRVSWTEPEEGWALSGAMAFHPASADLVVGCHSGPLGLLHPDGDALEVLHDFDGDAAVTALAFGPGGAHLVVGFDDGVVRVLDWATRAVVAEVEAHEAMVTAAAVSPDGEVVATGGEDTVIRVWGI